MHANSRDDTGWRADVIVLRPFGLLISPRTWLSLAFLLTSFVLGVFWFVVLVTLVSTGAGLAVTLVGLPILLLTMILWTWGARLERSRVGGMLGVRIANPYKPLPEHPWTARLRAFVTDLAVWRDFIYLILLFPIGLAEFIIAVVGISVSGAFATLPLYYWAIPDGVSVFGDGNSSLVIDTLPEALLAMAAGIPALLLVLWLIRAIASGHALLAQALLGTSQQELSARVDELSGSRTRVLDAAAQERRRIERDLHDGVQQQLTALALDLGMAREKLDADPAAAKALVARAHDEAKATLVELRQLVRGISPAILSDRGLDAAISALAARSPVPVTVDARLGRRLPETTEMTAYFVVAEALTNVARHSGATDARVTVRDTGDTLRVEVWDNGAGGADASAGTGLAGLADRVGAVDGAFRIDSPAGGPTTIRAEIPCAL
jgi:signal transduction histidine kinase